MSLSPVLAGPNKSGAASVCRQPEATAVHVGRKRLKKKKRLLRFRTFRLPATDLVSRDLALVPTRAGAKFSSFARNVRVAVCDQFGRSVGKSAISDGTINVRAGATAFAQVVQLTCVGRCAEVGGNEPVADTLLLPCGPRKISIGVRRNIHCHGCGSAFDSVRAIAEHLGISSAPLLLTVTSTNAIVPYREVAVHPEMQQYIAKATRGVWDQKHLPQISAGVLCSRLQHLSSQEYRYWNTPKYINLA